MTAFSELLGEQQRANELHRETNDLLSKLLSAIGGAGSGDAAGGGGGGGSGLGGGAGSKLGGLGGLAGGALAKAGGFAAGQLANIAQGAVSGAFSAGITGGSAAAIQGGAIQGVFNAVGQIPGVGKAFQNNAFGDLSRAIDTVAGEDSQLARQGFVQSDEQIRTQLTFEQAENGQAREAENRTRNIGNEMFREQTGQAVETGAKAIEVAAGLGVFGEELRSATEALRQLRLGVGGGG